MAQGIIRSGYRRLKRTQSTRARQRYYGARHRRRNAASLARGGGRAPTPRKDSALTAQRRSMRGYRKIRGDKAGTRADRHGRKSLVPFRELYPDYIRHVWPKSYSTSTSYRARVNTRRSRMQRANSGSGFSKFIRRTSRRRS